VIIRFFPKLRVWSSLSIGTAKRKRLVSIHKI